MLSRCEVNATDVEWRPGNVVGEGSFSTVYRGSYCGIDVAVKELKFKLSQVRYFFEEREYSLLKKAWRLYQPPSFPSRRTIRITSAPRRRYYNSSTIRASCSSWACVRRRRGLLWCWNTSPEAPCTASSMTPRNYRPILPLLLSRFLHHLHNHYPAHCYIAVTRFYMHPPTYSSIKPLTLPHYPYPHEMESCIWLT